MGNKTLYNRDTTLYKVNLTFCWCVCPVYDKEFYHNIVKVAGGSTRVSPRGSTATLMMFDEIHDQ